MPKSRGRKPRQRRRRSRSSGRRIIATVRPGQDLTPYLSDDDYAHMRAEIDAAAEGDALATLEHFEASIQVGQSIIPHQLRELVVLGDEAPAWMYSRWCLDAAYRWMLFEEDQRVDQAVRQLMVTTHVEALPEPDDPTALLELGTRIAGGDWLAPQLAVFEYAGLLDFLDVKAGPGLLDRTDRIREWADARLSGFVLVRPRGGFLRVRHLADGSELDVLDLGALTDRGPDETVIGRLVPISTDPGLMFESRPVSVDRKTAEQVALAEESGDWPDWVPAIAGGRSEGRLPYAFSGQQPTLYSSDIVPMDYLDPELLDVLDNLPPAPRMEELLDSGLDELEANAVLIAELAMVVMTAMGDDEDPVIGPHVATVLLEPRQFEAVKAHCTSPGHASVWATLAALVPEPARSRCAELARVAAA
jgi:hypothetical protein